MPKARKHRKPELIFPREHLHHRNMYLTLKQQKLLRHSQQRRSFLFGRNERGMPVDGTAIRVFGMLDKIVASDLPKKVKLTERDNWAEVLAMHLAFREKQANPEKKLDKLRILEEVHEMLKKKYTF